MLFLIKNTSLFKNTEEYKRKNQDSGLTYENSTIRDLVDLDTDGDKIPNWQESLYGLDPDKKETTEGVLDSVALERLKKQQEGDTQITKNSVTDGNTENLTQTEKFSRELFATIAAANQSGIIDETSIETVSVALVERINNPIIRKVFLTSDIKIIKDDSVQAIKKYSETMDSIQRKYPVKEKNNVLNIMQKLLADENNVDPSVLAELDPAIKQTQNIIDEILKINVPQSLVVLHLNLLNAGERVLENVSDMKLFEKDTILAMGGIVKYQENMILFQSALTALINTINKRLFP